MKTIKQLADELGLDKQKVYRYIKRTRINEAYQNNGVMYYDENAESSIIHHFQNITASSEAHQSTSNTSNDAVIDVLKETINTLQGQLEVKDNQISELTAALKASYSLHAGTIHNQKQLTGFSMETVASAEEPPIVTNEPGKLRIVDRLKQFFIKI